MKPALAFLMLMTTLLGCLEKKDGDPKKEPMDPVPAAQPEKEKPPSIMGTDSVPTLAALHDTILARAKRGDTVGLVRLMADDSAYKQHVYPLSSAYDPNRPEVFRFVLTMHKANNAKGLRRLLGAMQRDSGKTVSTPSELDSLAIPGGMIYRTRPSDTFRNFSEAVRQGSRIHVVSYSGARSKASRPDNNGNNGPSEKPDEAIP